jgi:cold-inducible RNA-binding protein
MEVYHMANNKLYVGNLSNDVTEEYLKTVFEEFGACISIKVIRNRFNGISKGFAFIEMAEAKAAQDAIMKCKGITIYGQRITVSEARDQRSQKSSGRSDRGRF